MNKLFSCFVFLLLFIFLVIFPDMVLAASVKPLSSFSAKATSSAEASPSSILKKESSLKTENTEKKEDITAPTPAVKSKLEKYLEDHPLKPLNPSNFLQHALRFTIKNGVPANTLVLILLFPLVVSLITASRHIVGIRGFGIFLPAVLSVVFVSTGMLEGILLFLTILLMATLARKILKKFRLQYLPRMALLLWFVSLAVLGLLFLAPLLNLFSLKTISIFPVLILMLLTENFISIQTGMSARQANKMTLQTLFVALVCSFVLQLDFLQKFALLKPELLILFVALFDIFMAKYTGLRWLEYKKFSSIIK